MAIGPGLPIAEPALAKDSASILGAPIGGQLRTFLQDENLAASLCKPEGCGGASRPGANDDGVELGVHC